MIRNPKILMDQVTLTTTLWDRLSLAGWNFLWLIYVPNLKFLTSSMCVCVLCVCVFLVFLCLLLFVNLSALTGEIKISITKI